MTTFSEFLLSKKFSQLNHSQESVETLSLWMLHHRRHATKIVKYWNERFAVISQSRKLAYLFVVDDILKASKEKNIEYHKEFKKILPNAISHIANTCTSKELLNQIQRLLNIWQNRKVFKKEIIEELWISFNGHTIDLDSEKTSKETTNLTTSDSEDELDPKQLKKIFMASNAPQPEELITALESFENMPSADQEKRAEIVNLPTKYTDLKSLNRLKDTKEAGDFALSLNKVMDTVDNYNKRLSVEISQRKKVNNMLDAFKESELERISDLEHQMAQVEKELERAISLREDIERHRNSLPDMKNYSSVQALPPLPSANDLFKKH